MNKITIYKSPSADSRSAKTQPNEETLEKSTKMHILDVKDGLNAVAKELIERGYHHDHTKLEMLSDFTAALNSGHIKDTEWYHQHITQERHHLKSNVPDDVNLIDVIEHIVDCTVAGMARSGEVYDVDIDPEVLKLAVKNTVELLKNNIEVVDEENNIEDEEI
jgi:hypothetical protein